MGLLDRAKIVAEVAKLLAEIAKLGADTWSVVRDQRIKDLEAEIARLKSGGS